MDLSFTEKLPKKWHYLWSTSGDLGVSLAVLDLGYAAKSFCSVVDFAQGKLLFDRSWMSLPKVAARVIDTTGEGIPKTPQAGYRLSTSFAGWGAFWEWNWTEGAGLRIAGEASAGKGNTPIRLDLRMNWATQLQPLHVAGSLRGEEGPVSTTKRIFSETQGYLDIGGDRKSWDGGQTGFDFSEGHVPRHTKWNWAFALMPQGSSLRALNLCVGNNLGGANENAAWIASEKKQINDVRFESQGGSPESWKISGQGTELVFRAVCEHAEKNNLIVAKSEFHQVFGIFSGTCSGQKVNDTPGILEIQDTIW